jgi:hypothetical protein
MTLVALFEKVDLLSLPIESLAHGMDSMGTVCSGTLVTGDRFTVSQNLDNQESVFVHDSVDNETTEISRDTAVLETTGGASSLSLGGLYSDTSGVKTIQDIIHMTPESSVLTSIEDSSVSSIVIDGSISWNRDDCCLYMAEDRVFRFKYNAGTSTEPPRLSLEALNQAGDSYIPKFEVEKTS